MAQTFTHNGQDQIVDLAGKSGLPLVVLSADGAERGALMSLGDDFREMYRSAAGFVAKILKEESPATIPVVPSAKDELVINLKTAKALGLTIPPTLLKRATRVIQ